MEPPQYHGVFGVFKSESILPEPNPTSRDEKRQIWSSNIKIFGFEKHPKEGKENLPGGWLAGRVEDINWAASSPHLWLIC